MNNVTKKPMKSKGTLVKKLNNLKIKKGAIKRNNYQYYLFNYIDFKIRLSRTDLNLLDILFLDDYLKNNEVEIKNFRFPIKERKKHTIDDKNIRFRTRTAIRSSGFSYQKFSYYYSLNSPNEKILSFKLNIISTPGVSIDTMIKTFLAALKKCNKNFNFTLNNVDKFYLHEVLTESIKPEHLMFLKYEAPVSIKKTPVRKFPALKKSAKIMNK